MNKEINMDEATLALRETLSHDYQLFFFNKMSFILYSKLLVYEITTFYYIYMSCRAVCGYFQVMLIVESNMKYSQTRLDMWNLCVSVCKFLKFDLLFYLTNTSYDFALHVTLCIKWLTKFKIYKMNIFFPSQRS